MNNLYRFLYKGERGLSGFWIIMIILVLGCGIFIASKFGPIYMAKWDLEDFMEDRMKNIYSIGIDGVYDDLTVYAEDNNLPFHPDQDCVLTGEIGQAGDLVCKYDVKIQVPGYTYIYHVIATKHVGKIPG